MFEATHTLRNERRDFVDWHRGRSPYAFWGLDLDCPPVRARVGEVAQALSPLLLADYCRQPHVTLALLGFPGLFPLAEDEFDPLDIPARCLLWQRELPFDLNLGNPASFSSAPYLAIEDVDGGIARLRSQLVTAADDYPGFTYVPHVTVGLYREAWPVDLVRSAFAAIPVREALPCRIEALCLMAYRPEVFGGALVCLARYELSSGDFSWTKAGMEMIAAATRV